jgi:hypothetical protein
LLLAHAVVHGFSQHGPGGYPLFRTVADLVDLGAGEPPETLARSSHRWLAEDMTFDEVLAICRLAQSLDLGLPAAELGGAQSLVLRHILAGVLDPDYEQALKLSSFGPGLTDRNPVAAFLVNTYHTVFPNRAQLEIIYPGPRSARGWFGIRLYRPVDLAVRTVRAAAAELAVARQRRRSR